MASTSKKNESSVLFDQPGPKGLRTIRIANIIAAAVFAVVLVLILMRLAAPPDGENQLSWELWKPALEAEAWTDFYLPGLWMTLQASILAVIGAVAFGLVFGIGRLLPNPLLRGVSAVVVEFCRAVPVLLMMIFFWRGFAFLGIGNSSYWAVVLALVLYNGSVVAELVRSGVGNLPSGQREASLALGLTETQSLMQIEVPQAVFAMLPAAVTQLVVVLKDTALGSIIMYTDLLQESRRLGSMYFNILQTLVVAAVIYFVFCWLLSRLAEWLPERMRQRTAAPTEAEAVAPIADHGPLQHQPDRRGQGGGREDVHRRRRPAPVPCAPPRLERLDPRMASHPVHAGLRRDASRKPGRSADHGVPRTGRTVQGQAEGRQGRQAEHAHRFR